MFLFALPGKLTRMQAFHLVKCVRSVSSDGSSTNTVRGVGLRPADYTELPKKVLLYILCVPMWWPPPPKPPLAAEELPPPDPPLAEELDDVTHNGMVFIVSSICCTLFNITTISAKTITA